MYDQKTNTNIKRYQEKLHISKEVTDGRLTASWTTWCKLFQACDVGNGKAQLPKVEWLARGMTKVNKPAQLYRKYTNTVK